jgi:hypothetical protein
VTADHAPPDFPAGSGPVRVVLVLDVLGRTVRVDEARHREVLAGLAAWEAGVQARAARAGHTAVEPVTVKKVRRPVPAPERTLFAPETPS